MIIDAWMQHPTRRFLAHDMLESLRRWTGMEVPEEEIPLEVTIAAMDAGGIDFGLLSAWHGPDGVLIGNDEVAAFVARHPDRLGGLAAVDLRDPVRAVRELRRCVTELGFKGLRVVPTIAATTRCTPSASSSASRSARRSATPARCARPRRAARSPTSTTWRSTSPTWSSSFGSNWPMIAPEKALEDLDDLELEPEACRRFLSENARAVFGV
jgi:predicted TIM-barrel fold metal-dependent hydrolase